MRQWAKVRIGDLCAVGDGAHASIARSQHGMMYLTSKNFKSDGLYLNKVDYISEEDFNKHFRLDSKAITKPLPGDVLVSIIGSLGEPYVVKITDSFGLSSSVAILRPNPDILSSRYLYYWMKGDIFQGAVYGTKGGVAQSYLSLEMIRSLPLSVPPLSEQEAIAATLSNYDQLIENNTRRIKILEQMARMLYREWLVDYRFPGYEKVKIADSGIGPLPEGWSIEPIANVAEILGGGTPSTGVPEYWENGDIDWYSPSDLTAASSMFMFGSSKKISQLGLRKSSARLFPPDSVMMTSRATIGVVAINRGPACTNQGFITCVPGDRISRFLVYFWIKENKEKITSHAGGATFKEISKSVFRELPIVVPSRDVLLQFMDILTPICGLIENLLRRNKILRNTRDMLLPKLISTEVRVEQLEREAIPQNA